MNADKARQILVFGTQPITDPGTHGRANLGEHAGMKLIGGAGMLGIICIHAS